MRCAVSLCLTVGLALAAGCLRAQAPPPAAAQATGLEVTLERIDVDAFARIRAFVTVVDPVGRAVTRFERRAFELFENAIRVKLGSYRFDVSPLSAAVVIDSSGSIQPALLDLKRAAAHFIRVLEPYDQAVLMTFAEIPRVLIPFTLDQDRLVAALGPLEAYGPTALYDAIHKAVLELEGTNGRRVIVLITDGQDQNAAGTARQSRHTLDEALQLAVSRQVVIHVIGLGPRVNAAELDTIATRTFGKVYRTSRSEDLEELYMRISRNLKGRLELTYETPVPKPDGAWRTLEVKVSAAGAYGAGQARYRAPGRYVMEVWPQGFDRLKVDELAREAPRVLLRDINTKEVLRGGAAELGRWLEGYFKQP